MESYILPHPISQNKSLNTAIYYRLLSLLRQSRDIRVFMQNIYLAIVTAPVFTYAHPHISGNFWFFRLARSLLVSTCAKPDA
jgi:hypothetical protein